MRSLRISAFSLLLSSSLATPELEVGNSPYIGGRGVIRTAVDGMIVNRLRAISVSENDPNFRATQTGYVHTTGQY